VSLFHCPFERTIFFDFLDILNSEVIEVTFKIKDSIQLYKTRHIGKIINMYEEKGITYYAVRISYPDGSSDHYYHMKDSDLKAIC